jgi:type II secretory pathway component PulM
MPILNGNRGLRLARRLREEMAMTVETAIGRWLACSVHPQAAWRVMAPRGRALLVGTYFGAAYLAALTLLLVAAR